MRGRDGREGGRRRCKTGLEEGRCGVEEQERDEFLGFK